MFASYINLAMEEMESITPMNITPTQFLPISVKFGEYNTINLISHFTFKIVCFFFCKIAIMICAIVI